MIPASATTRAQRRYGPAPGWGGGMIVRAPLLSATACRAVAVGEPLPDLTLRPAPALIPSRGAMSSQVGAPPGHPGLLVLSSRIEAAPWATKRGAGDIRHTRGGARRAAEWRVIQGGNGRQPQQQMGPGIRPGQYPLTGG